MRSLLSIVAVFAAGISVAQAADVQAGKAIFDATCHNCHSLAAGVNKVGPSLYGVVGRPSAVIQGYQYSPALKHLRTTWTEAALDAYLSNPRGSVHGVKMYFKGLTKPEDRANIIAYLKGEE